MTYINCYYSYLWINFTFYLEVFSLLFPQPLCPLCCCLLMNSQFSLLPSPAIYWFEYYIFLLFTKF